MFPDLRSKALEELRSRGEQLHLHPASGSDGSDAPAPGSGERARPKGPSSGKETGEKRPLSKALRFFRAVVFRHHGGTYGMRKVELGCDYGLAIVLLLLLLLLLFTFFGEHRVGWEKTEVLPDEEMWKDFESANMTCSVESCNPSMHVLDLPEKVCQRKNRGVPDRQHRAMRTLGVAIDQSGTDMASRRRRRGEALRQASWRCHDRETPLL